MNALLDGCKEMPIAQILRLRSTDFPHTSVAKVLESKDTNDPYYAKIKASMQAEGQRYPFLVAPLSSISRQAGYSLLLDSEAGSDEMVFGNGHHRLKLAMELGWTEVVVTDDLYKSGDDGWDVS
jgi:hypothetical protein